MDKEVEVHKPRRRIVTQLQVLTKNKRSLKLQIPVQTYKSIEIPGIDSKARLGVCYVKVVDIPEALDNFMELNPRVPNRNKKGVLSGPVIKGILNTLREAPTQMALKNQGIYLLVESANIDRGPNDKEVLSLAFTDPEHHGIINGGHTYSAIREAVQMASEDELANLQNAYVRLNIFQGINSDLIPEIAEGLNRSKQVDDPSLLNLQGQFELIRKVMKGKKGESAIAYHQGDAGDMYISEVLVYLSMMNPDRFDNRRQPNNLYYKLALGLKYFNEDLVKDKRKIMLALIQKLPDILWLSDSIRKLTPEAARANGFQFGRIKIGQDRAGNPRYKDTHLPFIDERVDYRVPNAWVYPMVAAFRANLKYVDEDRGFVWKVPLPEILPGVIDDLVSVCVSEHRSNNMRPELVGKKESAYSQCYTKVQLYLAKKNLLA